MNLNYETAGINFNSKGKVDEIATPQNIADDMVTLFDYTDCNRKIWLDVYCKTGNFLSSLKKQGVDKNNIAAICQTLQSQMLVCRRLYGKILPEVEVEIKIKSLESCKVTRRGQVYYISNWKAKVKDNHQEAYNLIKFVVMKEMERTMSLDWTTEEDFKINNIIMNPPYNSDMYIDFVELAHKLASENVVAITPAKWQAKGGQQNDMFRKDVVPYMSKIVYYPEETDVFDIRSACGISYYLVDRNIHKEKYIYNISDRVKAFNSGLQIREYKELDTLYNIGNTIVKKLGNTGVNLLSNDTSKRYKVALNTQVLYWGSSKTHCFFSPDGKSQVISNCKIFDSMGGKRLEVSAAAYVFSADNMDEIEYFKSWIDTKFIRFLVLIGFNVLTGVLNPEFWRFVPNPGSFNHIFTDQELYEKYSLTQEELNVIESVIKERK